MHVLQAVPEHRAVDLLQHVLAPLDDVVRPHAENAVVVRGVVDLAECQPFVTMGWPPTASLRMWAASSRFTRLSRQIAQAVS